MDDLSNNILEPMDDLSNKINDTLEPMDDLLNKTNDTLEPMDDLQNDVLRSINELRSFEKELQSSERSSLSDEDKKNNLKDEKSLFKHIYDLPPETIVKIYSEISLDNTIGMSSVSKCFYHISKINVWHRNLTTN